jgi:hypothetical protein
MKQEKGKIYHLRLTPEGREILLQTSGATDLSVSAICRKVAAKLTKGTMYFSDSIDSVVCLRRLNGNVVKISVSEKYYNAHLLTTPLAVPDMGLPQGVKSTQFRIALAAACIDVVDSIKRHNGNFDAQGKEGIDYNVPTKVLELRELTGYNVGAR